MRGRSRLVIGVLAVTMLTLRSEIDRDPRIPFALSPVASAAAAEPAADKRPALWALAVGVSQYQDGKLDLQFADSDARAVAAALTEQAGRRVYDEIHSLVLTNEQVTRESILTGIRGFIEKAQPEDVAVIFMAGHGVRDLITGTYYFLPHPATPADFFTQGLRLEEFNDMVRILQRHVRHVVVLLDTCHAGALGAGLPEMQAADDLAAQVRAEGVFLLAATKPGDESKEVPKLQHGVFTYALLNALRGKANTGDDGLLSLAELVIYLGAEVPRLTNREQTPYYLITGTDLVFADVRQPNSLAVLKFLNNGPHDTRNDWMGRSLQETFYYALDRVPVLHVCPLSPDTTARDETSLREEAQRLGCGKFVVGSFSVDRNDLSIRARVIDSATDSDEVTAAVQGNRAQFSELADQLVNNVLDRMPAVRAYRLMLEAQGADREEGETPPPERHEPARKQGASRKVTDVELATVMHRWAERMARPRARSPRLGSGAAEPSLMQSMWSAGVGVAYAVEPEATPPGLDLEGQVRRLLEEYREGHELKQIDRLASQWVTFSQRQREALRRHLDQADDLTLELNEIAIEPHAEDVTVAFTRIVSFVDRESGKPVRLEIRQRMVLVRQSEQWKIKRIESR
jgi:TolB-like protein